MVPAALVNSRADALMAAVGWPNPYVVSKASLLCPPVHHLLYLLCLFRA